MKPVKPPQEDSAWRGPMDGPWPRVNIQGDLERAEDEWLVANSLGAYSMSTVALMHTRRQHGLLVSHLAEDFRRHVVLSHLEMTLEVGGRSHRLSTHQFPDMAPTLGYRLLESFTADPLPRWVFRFPGGTIERTVSLVHDRQAIVIALTWSGKKNARLMLRPLMPMRPANELSHEHGGMLQKVTLRSGEVEVQPLVHLPSVRFQHGGVFMGFPDWWRKFEYLEDRGRYLDFQEDMWSPGIFEIMLSPRETQYLVVSVGAPPTLPPAELVMEAAQRRLASDPAHVPGMPAALLCPEVRSLCVAAESFVFGDGTSIIAGYPWLDVWARDTLLSIPGIFLARGQHERARRAIRHLLRNTVDDLLVSRSISEENERQACVDSSLWLFPQAMHVVEYSLEDRSFYDEVYDALVRVYCRFTADRRELAWLNADGLMANGAKHPLTWMESHEGSRNFTPRHGLAVEFQALWFRACTIMAQEAERRGDNALADDAHGRAQAAKTAFQNTFWCHETNHPFDCMSEHRGSADAWADPSIRPNALIALSVAPELFEPWQASEILARVEELLLTDYGIRTLDPRHPEYVGHVGDTIEEHHASSHQGAAWTHLLLFYVRAKMRDTPQAGARLRQMVTHAANSGPALGHTNMCVDGDSPQRFRGIPAYAMATGMLLEALAVDLAHVFDEE